MDVFIAVTAAGVVGLTGVLSTTARLTDGILGTRILAVSDAFECPAGACAAMQSTAGRS